MRTPWYGAERVVASSINQFTDWPIIDLDLSSALGFVSSAPWAGLRWWHLDYRYIQKPQVNLGVEYISTTMTNGTVMLEYLDNQGAWVNIDEATIPVVSGDLQLRFTITDLYY